MRKLLLILVSLFLCSCADPTSDPRNRALTACATGTAQIGVYDGFLQRLCGCQEGNSQGIRSGTALTCTIPLNTTLTFLYVATQIPHQIQSVGTPSFTSSAYSDPTGPNPVPAHAVTFRVAGSYAFRDLTDPGLSGTIVVTP
jgi:hypothetical protein